MAEKEEKFIEIYNVKSGQFKTIYCNEVYGGVTPDGRIEMNFFRTAHEIPEKVAHKIDEQGIVGDELKEKRKPKNAKIVRNFEVAIIMDKAGAKDLRNWLDEKIKSLEAKK